MKDEDTEFYRRLFDEAVYHLTLQTGGIGSMAADFDIMAAIDFRNRPICQAAFNRHHQRAMEALSKSSLPASEERKP